MVYRGYNLYPYPTVRRDSFSWLPLFALKDANGHVGTHADMVEHALAAFARAWDKNIKNNGTFHIALQFLRGKEKGTPESDPTLLYMRDAFGAISIIVGMLVGPNPNRGRYDTMLKCLQEVNVADELPLKDFRDRIVKSHPELWRAGQVGKRQPKKDEMARGTLSRPLANVENWILHMDDPKNAECLLSLPGPIQAYFLQVAIWLADLMVLKAVTYQGSYFNRLTMGTESVPWDD